MPRSVIPGLRSLAKKALFKKNFSIPNVLASLSNTSISDRRKRVVNGALFLLTAFIGVGANEAAPKKGEDEDESESRGTVILMRSRVTSHRRCRHRFLRFGENGGRPSLVDDFPSCGNGSGRGSTPVFSRGYNR